MMPSPAQAVLNGPAVHSFVTSIGHCLESPSFFGPFSRCRFDFTLFFEQSVISSSAPVLLLLTVPFRIRYLWSQDVKTSPNQRKNVNLAFHVAFVLLQLSLLVLWTLPGAPRTPASIPSTLWTLCVAATIIPLAYLENERSIRPSSLLSAYYFYSTLLDVAQLRTLYIDNHVMLAVVFGSTMFLRSCSLVLEERSKISILKPQYKLLPPESTSGIFSISLFWWLNGLFSKGSDSILTNEDLYELDHNLCADNVGSKLRRAWEQRSKPERRLALIMATFRAFPAQLAYTIVPRVFLVAFVFTQPFLITSVLTLLGKPENERTRDEGYALVLAMALVMTGIAVSLVHTSRSMFRFTTMVRGGMISLIYERTLLLEDGAYESSAAVSLMSNDVDQISASAQDILEMWSRVVEIAIGLPLLTRQLGWVSIVPLLVVIGPFYGAAIIAKLVAARRKLWGDATQQRLAITNSMLRDMSSLKMMGLNDVVGDIVQGERTSETKRMESWAWIVVWQNVIANVPGVMAPAATFGAYAIQAYIQGTASLNTVQVFTSLSLIGLVSYPTTRLLAAIPSAASSLGCFDRIQSYLLTEVQPDGRLDGEYSNGNTDSQAALAHKPKTKNTPVHEYARTTMLTIEHATFRPAAGAEIVLSDVSLRIQVGTIAMITGPVGAGKTTLLKAILGEVPAEDGSVYIKNKHIAYCSQTPWLQSGTIRRSIIGVTDEKLVDEEWYNTVIDACALTFDISKFPKKDKTVIGSRGVTLSGGQRHRLALARALYSRCEMFLLDDILSALDKKTEKIVADKMFGKDGLFKKLGSTVVMVTHATQYLPLANQIIVLSGAGQPITQGKYREIELSGVLDDLVYDETVTAEDHSEEEKDEIAMEEAEESTQIQDLKRRTGDLTTYSYYFKSIGLAPMLALIFSVLLQTVSNDFSTIWLKWWTDVKGTHISLYLSVYFLLAIGFVAGIGGLAFTAAVWIGGSTGRSLHRVLLDTVLRAPLSFFSRTQTGSILSRFSQDMTLIEGQLPIGLLVASSNLCYTIGSAVLLATGSPLISCTAPILIIVVYFLQRVYLRTSRQLRYLDLETRSPLYSHFLETLEGLSTIRAFGWEEAFNRTNVRLLDDSQETFYLLFCVRRWLGLVLDLMTAVTAVLVLGLAVTFRQWTDPGYLGVSMNSVLTFNESLSQTIQGWTMLETSLGAVSRLRSFVQNTPIEAKPGESTEPPASWPAQGRIEVKNVTVYHTPSAPALRNISLTILPGQKVGICGRTGSGKSTLLSTLLRTLDLATGNIAIDDLDLASLPRTTIRHRLTTIPQAPFHLPGTLRQTLDPFSRFSDEALVNALTAVNLYSLLLSRSPDPLSAPFLPDAYSQGQNQLLGLARAVVQKNQIVFLDEATSSVDQETDRVVREVMRREFAGKTVVSVAHRREMILGMDVVVLLDGGEVVEVGEPGELMGKESKLRELLGKI